MKSTTEESEETIISMNPTTINNIAGSMAFVQLADRIRITPTIYNNKKFFFANFSPHLIYNSLAKLSTIFRIVTFVAIYIIFLMLIAEQFLNNRS